MSSESGEPLVYHWISYKLIGQKKLLFPSVTTRKNPKQKRGHNSLGSTINVDYVCKDRIIRTIKSKTKYLCSFHPEMPAFPPLFFIHTITQPRNVGSCLSPSSLCQNLSCLSALLQPPFNLPSQVILSPHQLPNLLLHRCWDCL